MFTDLDSVLVVEDNPTDFLLLQLAFERAKFSGTLEQAESTDKAYHWIAQHLDSVGKLPDLVILDLGLPAESGMGMLEKLKGTREFAEIIVVVYSGSQNQTEMAKARQLGADWFFVKQSNSRELDYILKTLSQICRDKKDIVTEP